MEFLSIRNVTKTFGNVTALEDINVSINKGELVCLLGPSGCGKTTLLRIIAGLEEPDIGSQIIMDKKDITALSPAKRDFGIVFQSYALFPNLTCYKNVAYGLQNKKMSKTKIKERVMDSLKLVNLEHLHDRYPSQISGGQQQRIALARALSISPGFLLLDEPLSALDANVRDRLRIEIRNLQEDLGITTIMVTHDQEEALTMADRVVVMNNARIEQVGTPQDVYDAPASSFVASFIGTINEFQQRDRLVAIRPENIIVTKEASANAVKSTLNEMEFRGNFYRLYLAVENNADHDFEGKTIISDIPSKYAREINVEPGTNLYLEFPEERLIFYEALQEKEDTEVHYA